MFKGTDHELKSWAEMDRYSALVYGIPIGVVLAFFTLLFMLPFLAGCATLSDDPVKRAKQIEFYKQDALDTIELISVLVVDGESLVEFKERNPKKYLTSEYAFNRVLRRLEFAGEAEIVKVLQTTWDNLFNVEDID